MESIEMKLAILMMNLLVPGLMVVLGMIIMLRKPAETDRQVGNGLGFPGKLARRTKETWNFANSYGGSMYAIYGLYTVFATGFFMGLMYRGSLLVVTIVTIMLMTLQFGLCAVMAYGVTAQLKHLFHEDGTPIDPEKVWKRRRFGLGFGKDNKTKADEAWEAWNRDEWRDSWNEQWDDWDYWKKKQKEYKESKNKEAEKPAEEGPQTADENRTID